MQKEEVHSTRTLGKPWAQALVPRNRLGKMSHHACEPGFPKGQGRGTAQQAEASKPEALSVMPRTHVVEGDD